MKPKFLGTFPLADLNVDLFVDSNECGGSFTFRPTDTSRPRLVIGLDQRVWCDIVQVLLHETFEFCVALTDHQYRPTGRCVNDTGDYLFVFDHAEFSRICEYQSSFVARVMPVLSVAFKRVNSKKS